MFCMTFTMFVILSVYISYLYRVFYKGRLYCRHWISMVMSDWQTTTQKIIYN